MRVAGVSVGKVRKKTLDPDANRTLATIEIDRKFAPLHADAKAMLRQKTLLGETYVELHAGVVGDEPSPEGGRLANGQRQADRRARRDLRRARPADARRVPHLAAGPRRGHRGPRPRPQRRARHAARASPHDGADVLEVLDAQEGAVTRLVKNTGVTFGALTENEQQLREPDHVGRARCSTPPPSQQDNLAETIRIFPTFLDESKATLARLQTFSANTEPLIEDLRPVARDLEPTLHDVRAARARPRALLRQPRPADRRVAAPACRRRSEILRGLKPMLGRARPVPAAAQPDPAVPRGVAVPGLGLHRQRRGGARRHDAVDRAAASATTCASSARWAPRALAIYTRAPGDEPRQLLPRPARAVRRPPGQGLSSRTTTASRAAARSRRPRATRAAASPRRSSFGQGMQGDFPHVAAKRTTRRQEVGRALRGLRVAARGCVGEAGEQPVGERAVALELELVEVALGPSARTQRRRCRATVASACRRARARRSRRRRWPS